MEPTPSTPEISSRADPSTFSNFSQITTTHLHFDFQIHFSPKENYLLGTVKLSMKTLQEVDKVVLDCWNLDIHKCEIELHGNVKQVQPQFGDQTEMGQSLTIDLEQTLPSETELEVIFEYQTTDESKALSWLKPEQTMGKEHPFMFSLNQAIYARSMFPCQDTPSVKCHFSSKVKVQKPLIALMSAEMINEEHAEDHSIYEFKSEIPIPSYLISLCAGNLEFRKIGERCGIYAENIEDKSFIEMAESDLSAMEDILTTAEELILPYPLKNYYVVLMPRCFPYGGMEHPVTMFATSCLIVGDKSASYTLCHEITHSWLGNWVTNASWEDLWLNEGFTTYIQAEVVKRMYGEDYHKLFLKDSAQILEGIYNNKAGKGSSTMICPEIPHGVNPDDITGFIQYHKGNYFLIFLQNLIGLDLMFEFMRKYLSGIGCGVVTTKQFVQHFINFVEENFDEEKAKGILSQIDWQEWLYGASYPEKLYCPEFELWDKTMSIFEKFKSGEDPEVIPELLSNVWLRTQFTHKVMLEEDQFDVEKLKTIDAKLNFSDCKNCEIVKGWYHACIKLNYEESLPQVYNFLVTVGRMKFILPLFSILHEVNPVKAQELYEENRDFYHSVTRSQIEKILQS